MSKIELTQIDDEPVQEGFKYWKDVLEDIKRETNNYDLNTMCEMCIKQQLEHGVVDSNGNPKTTIKCKGLRNFHTQINNEHGEGTAEALEQITPEDVLNELKSMYNAAHWLDKEINNKEMFDPRPHQLMIDACSATRKVLRIGRRGGKSFILTVGLLHKLVFEQREGGYKVLMVAPMMTMVDEIVDLIKKFCDKLPENPILSATKTPIQQIIFKNGNSFKGVAAGAQGAKAVRGKGANLLVIDECFPANTQITIWNGEKKPISELKVNERILSWNEHKNRFVIKRVAEHKCTGEKDIYTYTTVSGKKLTCTENHPVWTREGWKPICEAKELATTKTKKGKYFFESIDSVVYKGKEKVYNIEVVGTHTYIADDFIVHNCDFLSPKDFNSILGILMDSKDTEFWACSTPIGELNLYKLSKDPNFKEFHFPSYVIPHFDDEMDETLRRQTTDTGYIQEVLANYGASDDSVFQIQFIEKSTIDRDTALIVDAEYVQANRDDFIVIIGADWNHDKIGTRIVTVAYHKNSGRYYIVQKDRVALQGFTQTKAVQKIVDVNRQFNADHLYVDEGYGATQVSLLRQFGQDRFGAPDITHNHPDLKLVDTVAVNFGSSITIKDPVTGEEFRKGTKQFLVENAADLLSRLTLVLHEENDADIIAQMKNYAVKNVSPSGAKTYTYKNKQIGDHDLDAYMLALYGFHKEYSVFNNTNILGGIASLIKPNYSVELNENINDESFAVTASSNLVIHTRSSILGNKFKTGFKNRTSNFKGRRRW